MPTTAAQRNSKSAELGRAYLLKWHAGRAALANGDRTPSHHDRSYLPGERLTLEEAVHVVEQWLAQQNIRFLGPGDEQHRSAGAGVLTNLSSKRCSQVGAA